MNEYKQLSLNVGDDDRLRLDDIREIAQDRLGRRKVRDSQILRAAIAAYHERLMKSENVNAEAKFLDMHKAEWGGPRIGRR